MSASWENIDTNGPETSRLKVEGGWLYRVAGEVNKAPSVVFVPQLVAAPQDEYDYGNMHRLCDILDVLVEQGRL